MNMFETATRTKLRIDSTKGALSVEQLWDLPLTSAKGVSLDGIGQNVQRELRDLTTDSLVDTTPSPRKAHLNLALGVIKHVIAAKQEDNTAKLTAKARADEKARLLEALDAKQGAKLADMSEEAINARLAEIA